jgi:hypothetical protein
MAVGMFRSAEGWVQVDYGTGNIPIPRSKYEEYKYKPDYDRLRQRLSTKPRRKRTKMVPREPRARSSLPT